MPLSAERRAILHDWPLLAALCLVSGLLGLGNHGLWNPDEPRDTGIGYEMWRDDSWLVPRLSGLPFLEKPPLYWWLQASVFSLFGVDATSARLASALLGLGTVGMTYVLGRRFFSRETATLAGLMLLTTSAFANHSHIASVDPALLFAVTGAVACFAHAESARGLARIALLLAMDAFLALGFFSKGLLGVGIPVLSMTCYLLWVGRGRGFAMPLLGAAAAVGALASVWLWGLYRELGAQALYEFLVQNHVERFFPQLADQAVGHRAPLYYYAIKAPREFLPWWPLSLLAVAAARRNWTRLPSSEREGVALLLSVLLPTAVLLSVAGTKRAVYLLPLAPYVALLTGWWMAADLPHRAWETLADTFWRRGILAFSASAPVFLACFGASALWLAAALALGSFGILSERTTREPRERWLRALTLTTLGWVCLLIGAPPLLDPSRSLEPAARELARALPRGVALHAIGPSETLRGIVSFYLDRPLSILPGPSRLPELAAQAPAWVVIDSEHIRDEAIAILRSAQIPHAIVHTRSQNPSHFWLLAVGQGPADLEP